MCCGHSSQFETMEWENKNNKIVLRIDLIERKDDEAITPKLSFVLEAKHPQSWNLPRLRPNSFYDPYLHLYQFRGCDGADLFNLNRSLDIQHCDS